jgi:dipeptide/tripeptide permease
MLKEECSVSNSVKNALAALFVLIASGVATWLFLPLVNQPIDFAPPLDMPVVAIGPIQVNLMLVVLLVAGGAPAAGLAMGLFVRWLSSKVPRDASTPPPTPAKKQAAAESAAPASEVEADLSLGRKLGLLALILVAIGATVVFFVLVLPPGFTLF